ncbi:MAG: DUF4131 domain-containing protein [Pyrinomonadaceae bacterium]
MQASVADEDLPTRNCHSFPLFALALCLISGVLCAAFLYSNPIIYVAIGCVSLAIAWWILSSNNISALTIFTSISFAAAGGALYSIHVSTPGAETLRRLFDEGLLEARQTREISGALVRPPEIAPDGVYLTLRVDRLGSDNSATHTKGVVWLFAAARDEQARLHLESLDLRRGTRVRVIAVLERSNRYRNPGVGMLTEFLERKGYDAVGSIKSSLLIERTGDEWIFPPFIWLDSWRDNFLRQMRQLFSPTTAGVLAASLWAIATFWQAALRSVFVKAERFMSW